MSGFGKAFGAILLFFLTLISYTPLKMELVSVAANSTLTNTGVVILNTVFGLIWILLAVFWLGLAVYYAMR
jgi:hypothetical protein